MASESFYHLDPQCIFAAVQSVGISPDGHMLQLNSYENRVFQLGAESFSDEFLDLNPDFTGALSQSPEAWPLIVKFYRPGRWTIEAIQDEHEFLFELKENAVHVVPPLLFEASESREGGLSGGRTIGLYQGLYFSLFPRLRARQPAELLAHDLVRVGKELAKLHRVGSQRPALHRPWLNTNYYGGWDTLERLYPLVSPELAGRYEEAAIAILKAVDRAPLESASHRIHGDCHLGNLLFKDEKLYLVDFDDFINGPAVQDFWMLVDVEEQKHEWELLLSGYEELCAFEQKQLAWVPLLRGLRLIGYSGWIASRYQDPSFPKLFPQFSSYSYWAEETEALEKIAWRL